MNARTYIHSLPDAPLVLNPNAYTIIDYANELGEYYTNKITLCAIADFTILAYTYSEFFQESEEANAWVNSNSAVLNIDKINLGSFQNGSISVPLSVYSNSNFPVYVSVRNINTGQDATSEIRFENNDIVKNLVLGIQGSNFFNPTWTLGNPGDSYIYSRDSNLQIGTRDPNDIIFYSNGAFRGNERIVVKGDGTGFVGINTRNPKTSLTVAGAISTNDIVIDERNNLNFWKQIDTYVSTTSTRNEQVLNFVNSNSSQILFKTGGVVSGPLITTKTSIPAFLTNELVSKRYVDAIAFATTVSGNFIPALYYTITQVDDLLVNPYSVYAYVNYISSFNQEVNSFTEQNSSNLINVSNLVNLVSGDWNSVYSYINTTSSNELNQTNSYLFVFSNSSNIVEVLNYVNSNSASFDILNTVVNNASANWNSVYSYTNSNSSFNLESRTFVNKNSTNILDLTTTVNFLSSRWQGGYTYARDYSAINNEINSHVSSTSGYVEVSLDSYYEKSPKWDSVYSNVNSNSASYTTKPYNDALYLSKDDGGTVNANVKIYGDFYADTFGVGNLEPASTLGNLIGRIEIFNDQKTSIGYLPVYDNIT
jgi:hypothetical protein